MGGGNKGVEGDNMRRMMSGQKGEAQRQCNLTSNNNNWDTRIMYFYYKRNT